MRSLYPITSRTGTLRLWRRRSSANLLLKLRQFLLGRCGRSRGGSRSYRSAGLEAKLGFESGKLGLSALIGLHIVEIGLHTQFIGEIVDVKAESDMLGEDGQPDIMKIKPLIYDTAHKGYHGVGPLLGRAFSVGKTKG